MGGACDFVIQINIIETCIIEILPHGRLAFLFKL